MGKLFRLFFRGGYVLVLDVCWVGVLLCFLFCFSWVGVTGLAGCSPLNRGVLLLVGLPAFPAGLAGLFALL